MLPPLSTGSLMLFTGHSPTLQGWKACRHLGTQDSKRRLPGARQREARSSVTLHWVLVLIDSLLQGACSAPLKPAPVLCREGVWELVSAATIPTAVWFAWLGASICDLGSRLR